ncbi:MAG TPA: HD domain-containing phosphohydrolase [Blastocatellia bacterium]|nr:HD domain-containing phosphohydrolase [Blastocatellia bacterium]
MRSKQAQDLEAQLLSLAAEADEVERYSTPHATFIAQLSEALGRHLGLRGSDLVALRYAALVHDLGERVMKRDYLERRGELTWDERLDLWRHPVLGEQAAAQRELPRQAQLLIRWHHEWWNGQGYPDALAGENIPLGARILRLADTYSALTSARPYRSRMEAEAARQVIIDSAGLEFDPQVVQAFIEVIKPEL